jgi:hypothetical protein
MQTTAAGLDQKRGAPHREPVGQRVRLQPAAASAAGATAPALRRTRTAARTSIARRTSIQLMKEADGHQRTPSPSAKRIWSRHRSTALLSLRQAARS